MSTQETFRDRRQWRPAVCGDVEPAQPKKDQEAAPLDNKLPYAVGYGRPPQHSQFKKGCSGNPRGRPKQSGNLRSQIQKVLTDSIPLHVGGKNHRVPALVALHRAMLQRAFKGDHRVAAAVLKTAKEFGLLEQAKDEIGDIFRDEVLGRLSDEAFFDVWRVLDEICQEADKKKKR